MAEESLQNNFFDTEYLKTDLKGRSVRGGAVTMAAQGTTFFLGMASTIVLARLLTPQDFGLIAMVTAVIGFVVIFKDMGLSMATVQKAEINHGQISTLFWINVVLSLGVMLVTAALAPAIAWFYGEPRLTWITLALAGAFIFGGLTVQHQALLRRQMRFGSLALIQIISMSVGILTAVIAAWYGAGYWALVIMQLSGAIAGAIAVWVACGWRPGQPVRRSGVREMLAFGGNVTAANVLNYVGSNLDYVLIGRYWGAGMLGFYKKAYSLLLLPLRQVNYPIAAVALPAMSRIVDQPGSYRKGYLTVLEQLAIVTAPMVAFMIVCSDWLIDLILGPQWADAAIIFSILGFAGLILPIWNSTGWVFMSQGRAKEHLKFQCISSVFKVVSIVAGLPWGGVGVAIGVAIRYYLIIPILFYMVGRRGPIRSSDFYKTLRFPAILTAICFIFLYVFKIYAINARPVVGLLIAFIMVVSIFFVFSAATRHGRTLLASFWKMICAFVPKRGHNRIGDLA